MVPASVIAVADVTRDELIARTRQLVDEGDRLQQDPSLRGLQTWLQLSRRPARRGVGLDGPLPPLLADGRQAEADRPRPADDARRGGGLRPRGRRGEDVGAPDEPRRGRAAGHAVRRRGTRHGARAGDGDAARRTRRRDRRERPRSPPAARAESRSRTRSPATTSCSRSASTSTSRASSTATSARPTSRREVDVGQLRPPAAPRRGRRRAPRSAPRRGRDEPSGATGSRPSSSRSGRRPRRSPATSCRTSST